MNSDYLNVTASTNYHLRLCETYIGNKIYFSSEKKKCINDLRAPETSMIIFHCAFEQN